MWKYLTVAILMTLGSSALAADRKYSVAEIDRLRHATELSFVFEESTSRAQIEDRVRTYMQNGTDPDELERVVNERINVYLEHTRLTAEQQRKYVEIFNEFVSPKTSGKQ